MRRIAIATVLVVLAVLALPLGAATESNPSPRQKVLVEKLLLAMNVE